MRENCPDCGGLLPEGLPAASVKVPSKTPQVTVSKSSECNCGPGAAAYRAWFSSSQTKGPTSGRKPLKGSP